MIDLSYIYLIAPNLDHIDTPVKSCDKKIFDHQYQNVKFSRRGPSAREIRRFAKKNLRWTPTQFRISFNQKKLKNF